MHNKKIKNTGHEKLYPVLIGTNNESTINIVDLFETYREEMFHKIMTL